MSTSTPTIFVGLTNIASQLGDIQKAFNSLGAQCITAVHQNHAGNIINNVVDYDFSTMKKYWFGGVRPRSLQKKLQKRWLLPKDRIWRKVIKECDVFIFMWSTFAPDYADIAQLKKMGKKVINVFVGDDARWYYSSKQEYEFYGMQPPEYDQYNYSVEALQRRLLLQRTAEKYADFVFSRLDQAQLALRPYYRWNMMVNSSAITCNPTQRKDRPLVLHAPSSKAVKGTKYILQAFDRLKKEGVAFETKLIENLSHLKALELYRDADILIDQLLIPGTGKLATEGLASGCVVMAHMGYDNYPQNNPPDCPIIDVNPDNIYQRLKEIIQDYDQRQALAKQGRPYVEKHLDVKYFCEKVLKLVTGEKVAYDYTPTFFREHFIPESEEAKAAYNHWNEFVKDCNWYQELVPSGERSGLKF